MRLHGPAVLAVLAALALAAPPAFGQWSKPEAVSDSGKAAERPAIAAHAGGVSVAWGDTVTHAVHYREKVGPWGGIEQITRPAAGESDSGPDLAVDSAGNIYCAFQRRDKAAGTYSVYLLKRSAGAWGAPILLSSGSAAYAQSPSIAVDRKDRLHVVFSDYKQPQFFGIRYRTFDGSAWTPPLDKRAELIAGSEHSFLPRVAADPSGTPHAVWMEYVNGVANHEVYYSRRSGGSWSPAINVTPGSATHTETPAVAVGAQGRVHIAWIDFDVGKPYGIFHRALSERAWSPALAENGANLSGPTNSYNPAIAVDAQGRTHVCWETLGNKNYDIWHAAGGPSGWSPAEMITPQSAQHTEVPSLAIDAKGTLHMAYLDDPGGRFNVHYMSRAAAGR